MEVVQDIDVIVTLYLYVIGDANTELGLRTNQTERHKITVARNGRGQTLTVGAREGVGAHRPASGIFRREVREYLISRWPARLFNLTQFEPLRLFTKTDDSEESTVYQVPLEGL